jgi:hypothetical protein
VRALDSNGHRAVPRKPDKLIKKHIKKHLAARACAGQNTHLGKKNPNNAGVDFYITAQAVELHQENPHQYDELASGRLVGGLNTYAYVGGNPISFIDPEGLQAFTGQTPPSSIPGGPWTPNPNPAAPTGNFLGPKQSSGGRVQCQYVPDGKNGGPSTSKVGYWKTNSPDQKGWQRYNLQGQPITPGEAHPGNPLFRGLGPLICPACFFILPELLNPGGLNSEPANYAR